MEGTPPMSSSEDEMGVKLIIINLLLLVMWSSHVGKQMPEFLILFGFWTERGMEVNPI